MFTLFNKLGGGKIALAITGILAISAFIVLKPYYTPAKRQAPYPTDKPCDDTLRIAFLGDSWASQQQKHLTTLDSIAQTAFARPVKTFADGAPGAKSKEVYYNMFSDKIHKNKKMYQKDFQHILEKGMDYCIISAGINDASTKVGASFYATNMELIIHHLAAIGTVPVILEIPQFDIHKAYRQTSIPTKLLRHISMTVNNDSIDCIGKYRTALAKMLAERHLEGKIIYIPHTEWSENGYSDARGIFSNDGVHLNKKGFLILDQCIIRHIREHASAGNKATF